MKWIPLSERKPAREDGDEHGLVLARGPKGVPWIMSWDQDTAYPYATHFARLRDIELPPPAPVMPERLEFVKAKPSEASSKGDLWMTPDGYMERAYPEMAPASPFTLYRRVSPGKRIVFEVGEKRPPKRGEWHLPLQSNLGPARAINDFETSRTILRCVEGEEYLK